MVQQCQAAGVPVFVKQLGSKSAGWCRGSLEAPEEEPIDPDYCDSWEGGEGGRCPGRCVELRDRKGGDMSEWPADLRAREFPTVPQAVMPL